MKIEVRRENIIDGTSNYTRIEYNDGSHKWTWGSDYHYSINPGDLEDEYQTVMYPKIEKDVD